MANVFLDVVIIAISLLVLHGPLLPVGCAEARDAGTKCGKVPRKLYITVIYHQVIYH